ncbi:poly(U)-specific 3'-to-5' RNA exonuclease, partial [Ascosphaera pollenicola]
GVHNLCIENHVIPDPDLTQLGVSQCEELARRFPYHSEIDLIVVSPIRRTIYTALYAFAERIKQGNIKVIALPEIQEISDVPCDTGSDLPVLRKEVEEKGLPVDLSLLDDQWNVKKGKYAPQPNEIMARARRARQWLKNRPESNIAVVTHGGFLHYFTEDWQDCAMYQ